MTRVRLIVYLDDGTTEVARATVEMEAPGSVTVSVEPPDSFLKSRLEAFFASKREIVIPAKEPVEGVEEWPASLVVARPADSSAALISSAFDFPYSEVEFVCQNGREL